MFVKNAGRYCNQTSSVVILLAVITTFVVSSLYLTRFWLKKHANFKGFELDNTWDYRRHENKSILVPVKGPNGQLIYVSNSTWRKFATVHLEFQDTSEESCEVKLHLHRDPIDYRKVFGLGNGKIVVLVRYHWIKSSWHQTKMISSTEWYGFVIDSVTCTSNTFNLPYPDFELMDAIPYHNEFDLLLKLDNGSTSNSQRALRYHDDGQFTTDVAFSTTFEDHQRLKSVKPFDPSEGFYYISRMQSDNGLTFEKLSPEFDLSEIHGVHLMRSKPISPMAYSLSNEEISICGFELVNTTNMKCLITDVQFSLIRLDVVMSFPHRLDNLIVKSLGNGGALLIFRWAFNDNRTSGVYFLHLRDKGLARQPTEIVRYFRPVSGVYVMEMDGGKYCVTVVGESSFITRCISPTF